MTFRDTRKANFYARILDTDGFGENATYRPAGGGTTAAGGPARSIVVKIDSRQAPAGGEQFRSDEETITVTAGRDENHAKGGIANPQVGDTLARAGEDELPAFGFTGEIVGSTGHSWRLLYKRRRRTRVGDTRRN